LKKTVAKQDVSAQPRLSLIVVPRVFPNPQLKRFLQSTELIGVQYEVVLVTNHTQEAPFDEYAKNLIATNPKMSQVTIADLAHDPGLALGRNIGAALANSNNLFFCDDDIVLVEDISPLLAYLEDNRAQSVQPLILRFSDRAIIDSAGDWLLCLKGIYHAKIRAADRNITRLRDGLVLEQLPSLRGAFFALRKDVWRGIGGFDGSFYFNFEDVDMGWRLTLAGYKNLFVPSVKVLHAGGRTTKSNAPDQKTVQFHIVNHHALQLKISGIAAWPFIISRFEVFTLRCACRCHFHVLAPLNETLAMNRMLVQRLGYVRLHRKILKETFHYAGRETFRAMVKHERFPVS
jgi:GT2 family glycosyltransferase